MIQELEFEKDLDGGWYIVLPDWPGDRSALAMVAGADKLLDRYNYDGTNRVQLVVKTSPLPVSFTTVGKLKKLFNVGGGATYFVRSERYTGPIWLCEVTKFVFGGKLPKRIYFKEL